MIWIDGQRSCMGERHAPLSPSRRSRHSPPLTRESRASHLLRAGLRNGLRNRSTGNLTLTRLWPCLAICVCLQAGVALAQGAERRSERPLGQAHGSVSYMERTFVFPAKGACEFDYFVDSEAGHDFLRARVDGAQSFAESGSHRAGRATISVAAGTHVVRIAYERDASGSAGRDTAWVDNLRCVGGTLQASYRFDDPLLSAPLGWQSGGASGSRVCRTARCGQY